MSGSWFDPKPKNEVHTFTRVILSDERRKELTMLAKMWDMTDVDALEKLIKDRAHSEGDAGF